MYFCKKYFYTKYFYTKKLICFYYEKSQTIKAAKTFPVY